MERLAQEEGLAAYLGALGRERAKLCYDIERVADRYICLYEELIASK